MLLIATFEVAGTLCGIDAMKVQEVVRVGEVTPVHHVPKQIVGVINLRGKIVTVIDLGVALEIGQLATGASSRIFIVEITANTSACWPTYRRRCRGGGGGTDRRPPRQYPWRARTVFRRGVPGQQPAHRHFKRQRGIGRTGKRVKTAGLFTVRMTIMVLASFRSMS